MLKNIIRQQTVHVQYNGQADGFALQQAVGEWCQRSLLPQIEQQLEPYCRPDWYMVMDRLEITVEATQGNWQADLQQQVTRALEEKLAHLQMDSPVTTKPVVPTNLATADGANPLLTDHANRSALTHPKPSTRYQAPEKNEAPPIAALEGMLPDTINAPAAATQTWAQRQQALVLYFLQWGHLPWWSNAVLAQPFPLFLQQWLGAPQPDAVTGLTLAQRVQGLVAVLRPNPTSAMVHRLLLHLPPAQLSVFAKAAFPLVSAEAEGLAALLEGLQSAVVQQRTSTRAFWLTLTRQTWHDWLIERLRNPEAHILPQVLTPLYGQLHQSFIKGKKALPATNLVQPNDNPVATVWQQIVAQQPISITNSTIAPSTLSANTTAQKGNGKAVEQRPRGIVMNPDAEEILQEGLFIENAGLVIAAPFLPALFGNLRLAANGQLVNPGLAAVLAQHLVSGQTMVQETELLLPKLLCGIEPDEVVDTHVKITSRQKKEATELLTSLIEHWGILKNTSVPGLREAFLQRSGKLSITDNQWLLRVEQKAFDMLLLQLPWNIGMIKLPWMQKVLITEWV